MSPFTTLLEVASESAVRRRRGIFVSKKTIGVMTISGLILVFSLCAAVYKLSRWHAIKEFTSDSVANDSVKILEHHHLDSDTEKVYAIQEKVLQRKDETRFEEKLKKILVPGPLKPLEYWVRLIPNIGDLSIKGFIEISFESMSSTNTITLSSKNIFVKRYTVKLRKKYGSELKITKQFYEKDFYVLVADTELIGGSLYTVFMEFQAKLNKNGVGFYVSDFYDELGEKRVYSGSHFYPTFTKEAFPCLREPSLAKYTVQIGRDRKARTLSNMPRESVDPVIGTYGYYWDTFETSLVMQSYSVAFVLSNFLSSFHNGSVKVWSRETLKSNANCVYDEVEKITGELKEFFKMPLPLAELDVVLLPNLKISPGGGHGLITLRESDYLCHIGTTSTRDRLKLKTQLRYALAKQWLGYTAELEQLWIIEGIATYLQFRGQEEPLNGEAIQKVLESEFVSSTRVEVDYESLYTLPPNLPNKSGAIFHMIDHFLKKSTLRNAIARYASTINKPLEDVATNFLEILSQEAKEGGAYLPDNVSLNQVLDTWALNSGYPLVHLSKINDSYYISQEALHASSNSTRWFIPITYTTKINPDFRDTSPKGWITPDVDLQWITNAPMNGWIIFNIQQAVLCRVNYDPHNWMALTYQLHSEHRVIEERNRAQLLDDSAALARIGILDYDAMMNLHSYLEHEERVLPWETGLKNFKFLQKMFRGSAAFEPLRIFVLSRITNIYSKLENKHANTSTNLTVNLLRIAIMESACALGHQACLERASELFEKWKANPDHSSVISPDERFLVFCTAIAEGSESDWNFVWNYTRNIKTHTQDLVEALGCTKDHNTLQRSLNKTLQEEEKLTEEETVDLIIGVAQQPKGWKIGWTFVKENWQQIFENLGDGFGADRILGTIAQFMNSQKYLEELEDFHKKYYNSFPTEFEFGKLFKVVRSNIVWLKRNAGQIYQWLHNKGFTGL